MELVTPELREKLLANGQEFAIAIMSRWPAGSTRPAREPGS